MANRFWVGGTATWDATVGTKWAATSGGAGGVSVPTAADDVFFDSLSTGTITTSGTAVDVCRSLNCTGFTGTLSHAASTTITIGDATAGASNVALLLSAGMTYTKGGGATSVLSFVSTSATQQTVKFNSQTIASATFAGVGGSWLLQDAMTQWSTNGVLTLTNGTLNTNGVTVTMGSFSSGTANARTLTCGASSLNFNNGATCWDVGTGSLFTLNANTSTLTFAGAASAMKTGGLTYNNVVFNGSGAASTNASASYASLTRTGTAAKTDSFNLVGTATVSGTFTCNGNSIVNRMLVQSTVIGTTATISAATVAVTNTDFMDITGSGAGSWNLSAVSGGSGDAKGNTGITFTTGTSTALSGASPTWSTGTWSSRVPLPQDNVTTTATGTISLDMPLIGKDIDLTGFSGTMTHAIAGGVSYFGSMTLGTGMSLTASGGNSYNPSGRGTHTYTSNGAGLAAIKIQGPGGTYTLQDSFKVDPTLSLTITDGALNTNGAGVSVGSFTSISGRTRALSLGASTFTLSGTGTVWNVSSVATLTTTPGTSTIVISDTSATAKTFSSAPPAGAVTYGNMQVNGAAGAGAVTFTGSSLFNTLILQPGSSVIFTTTQTHSFASINAVGTAANRITIASSSAGTTATLQNTGQLGFLYFGTIRDITVTGGLLRAYDSVNSLSTTGISYYDSPTTFNNYQSIKVADGMSTGERIR